MDDMNLSESIRIMCETILKEHNSMECLIQSSMDKVDNTINKINKKEIVTNEDIKMIKEMNKVIDSVNMYEWLLIKKIEAVEELIRYI